MLNLRITSNVLQMARILGGACSKFREFGIEGISLDCSRIDEYVGKSLMRLDIPSSM